MKRNLITLGLVIIMAITPVTVSAAPQSTNTTVAVDAKTISTSDRALLQKMFDAKFYAKTNPEVVKVLGGSKRALFAHFLQYGINEGRQMNAEFNPSAYRSAYKDLNQAFGGNILSYYRHYATIGKKEARPVTTVAKAQENGIIVTDFAGKHVAVDNNGNLVTGKVADTIINTNVAYVKAIDNLGTFVKPTPIENESNNNNSDSNSNSNSKTGYNQALYQVAHQVWENHEPEKDDFSESYKASYLDWMSSKPNPNSYVIAENAAYQTKEAAEQAFNNAMGLWIDNTPTITLTAEEQTAYENAHHSWESDEPQASNYVVNEYTSTETAKTAYDQATENYNLSLPAQEVGEADEVYQTRLNQYKLDNPAPSESNYIYHENGYANAQDAQNAYVNVYNEWGISVPVKTQFALQEAKDEYDNTMEEYEKTKPSIDDAAYSYPTEGNYANQEEADAAYEATLNTWGTEEPVYDNTLTENEQTRYDNSMANWKAHEPQTTDLGFQN